MAQPRSALFAIDIQHDLAGEPSTRIPGAERLVDAAGQVLTSARALIDSYRGRGAASPFSIVVVQHEEAEGAMTRGSKAWEVIFPPREGVAEETLVAKTTSDTFESNSDLAERLRADGVTHIVAFGIQSDMCVENTSNGALAAGFDVTLLSGAHGTYDYNGKTAAQIEGEVEQRLRDKGVRVVPWQEAVASWDANAKELHQT